MSVSSEMKINDQQTNFYSFDFFLFPGSNVMQIVKALEDDNQLFVRLKFLA